jgi:hypothetical protein
MKRRLLMLLCTAALLAGVPLPAAADSPDDDTFVFISTDDGDNFYVTIGNGRGGGQRHLTSKVSFYRPAISPDGTRVAFSAPIGDATLGVSGIAVANLDGTGFQGLTSPKYADFSPTWSPDGTRIAFIRDTESNLNVNTCCVLRVMDADGSNKRTIPGTVGAANPAWSPAGNEIAYNTAGGLFVTNLSGNNKRTIAAAGRTQPAWSPDGSEIAFVRDTGSEHRIVVSNPNGGNADVWYATPQTIESPTWDLDGDTISFVRHSGVGQLGRTSTQVWSVNRAETASRLFVSNNNLVHLDRYTRRGPECDFNGDARSDLAVGLPGQAVDGNDAAGAVEILYGHGSGLRATNSQQLHRGLNFVAGSLGNGAAFGKAVVCGDFDGDLFSDLAIGAPGADGATGSVTVMYGSASGLTSLGDLWSQDSAGILGAAGADEDFGAALGAGDFNGDGYFDLAVGAPGDRIDGTRIGSVNILYGSAAGLTNSGDQLWNQESAGIKGAGAAGDRFGAALAAADFDGDGRDDLAIGAPNDRAGGKRVGAVNVIYGSKKGLGAGGDERWHQDVPGVNGKAKAGEKFGAALAAADFGGDGDGDLAIGVPKDIHEGAKVGAINVLYGQPSGLSSDYDDRFHQDSPGIMGGAAAGDLFGKSLMAGDFDGDNRTDLAIGVPGDRPGGTKAGVAAILYAQPTGLDPEGNQRWHQNSAGISGSGETGDKLGAAVAVGDFDGDGYVDLAIGVPGEDLAGFTDAGAIHVIYGTANGLTATGQQVWNQGIDAMAGSLQSGDRFGASAN